jgi:amino acid permease
VVGRPRQRCFLFHWHGDRRRKLGFLISVFCIHFPLSQIAAGETKNPRRNLPRAIRRVYIRILLFYILGTFVIGLLVPSNNSELVLASGAAASPFVIAIQTAGIKSLPSVGTDTI